MNRALCGSAWKDIRLDRLELFGAGQEGTRRDSYHLHGAILRGYFLHLYYNWRPFMGYLKNLSRRVVILTKEMLIAMGISLLFVWGTLAGWHPFSDVVELGATLKEGWEKSYVQPPFNPRRSPSSQTACH